MNESTPPTSEQLALRIKWVEALRSGKYQQGRQKLCSEGRFCCLGVLCDVIDPEGWVTPTGVSYSRYRGQESAVLPESVASEVGIEQEGRLPYQIKTDCPSLIALNDGAGFSFEQIAQVIEDQFITPYLEVSK